MDIYQHFRQEERPFIDQVLSWQNDVELRFQRKLSDFLNPREQQIFQTILGNHPDLKWGMSGGAEHNERKRAIVAPEYEVIHDDDYQLIMLEATYPEKFITLEHPDVLGAFMSLGIKREKLGDLFVGNGKIQIVTEQKMSDYIRMNLTGVKRATVHFEDKPLTDFILKEENWMVKDSTVSSLRLDVLIKEIYGMSRKKAAMHIEAGHVKVNFRMVENSAFVLEEGDLISLRGEGRSRLDEVHRRTKKDKLKITTAKLN